MPQPAEVAKCQSARNFPKGSESNIELTVETQVLPAVDINPNGEVNVCHIYDILGVWLAVADFVPGDREEKWNVDLQDIRALDGTKKQHYSVGDIVMVRYVDNKFGWFRARILGNHEESPTKYKVEFANAVKKQWVYIGADEGGMALTHLLAKDEKYSSRFIVVVGAGHEFAIYLRLLMKMAWNYGMKALAEEFGFSTPVAMETLQRAADLHKGRDFLLEFARPVIVSAIYRGYICSLPASQRLMSCNDFNSFMAYVNSEAVVSDKTLSNAIRFWILHDIPALACMLKGMRQNDYTSYQAGRKSLLPLAFSRNSVNYGPLAIRDIFDMEIRAPPEVKMQRIQFHSNEGEGFDFRLEDVNHKVKQDVSGMTFFQYVYASIMLNYGGVEDNLRSVFDVKKATHSNERSVNFASNILFIEKELALSEFFHCHPNRPLVSMNDEHEPLLAGADSLNLHSQGVRRIGEYIRTNDFAVLRGDKGPTFPKLIPMIQSEVQVARTNTATNQDEPSIGTVVENSS